MGMADNIDPAIASLMQYFARMQQFGGQPAQPTPPPAQPRPALPNAWQRFGQPPAPGQPQFSLEAEALGNKPRAIVNQLRPQYLAPFVQKNWQF